jgi:hypothetical protein
MKLYDINSEMLALIDQVNEDGEIETSTLDLIMSLQITEADKIEGIVNYIKDLQSDAKAIKEEEETLKARRQAKENKADSLKEFISQYLINTERDRFETSKCVLSFRKSQAVAIFDELVIPDEYRKFTLSFDKAGMKDKLKSGEIIPGASLQENKSLQIK